MSNTILYTTFIYISVFLFSISLGSFSSYLMYRFNKDIKKESLKNLLTDRSRCPRCFTILKGKDLFPIFSWLFLKGKCRYCKMPISKLYPIMEIIYGILFTFLFYCFFGIGDFIIAPLVLFKKLFLNLTFINSSLLLFSILLLFFTYLNSNKNNIETIKKNNLNIKKIHSNVFFLILGFFGLYNFSYLLIMYFLS